LKTYQFGSLKIEKVYTSNFIQVIPDDEPYKAIFILVNAIHHFLLKGLVEGIMPEAGYTLLRLKRLNGKKNNNCKQTLK